MSVVVNIRFTKREVSLFVLRLVPSPSKGPEVGRILSGETGEGLSWVRESQRDEAWPALVAIGAALVGKPWQGKVGQGKSKTQQAAVSGGGEKPSLSASSSEVNGPGNAG